MVRKFVFNDDIHFYGKPCRVCGRKIRYRKGTKQCVTCKLRIRKEQYQANPEKEQAAARQWHKDNPEKSSELRKKFDEDNPEYHKEWQRRNRDRVAEYARRYRKVNREKINRRARERAKTKRQAEKKLGTAGN